jgi:hypothetical protein
MSAPVCAPYDDAGRTQGFLGTPAPERHLLPRLLIALAVSAKLTMHGEDGQADFERSIVRQ